MLLAACSGLYSGDSAWAGVFARSAGKFVKDCVKLIAEVGPYFFVENHSPKSWL